MTNDNNIEAIFVSGTWPKSSTGAEIAARSALHLYADRFQHVHFFGPADEAFEGGSEWDESQISWVRIPYVRGPLWLRFLKSIFSADPAITVRFRAASESFLREITRILADCEAQGRSVVLIYDDLPASCLVPDVRKAFPGLVQVVRSHNVLVKGFAGLDQQGSLLSRMAWRLELAKIRKFEIKVCTGADIFWAISADDDRDYRELLDIKADGIVGLSLESEPYATVPPGDACTVVHVGSADLRKGRGLRDFIEHAWPTIRTKVPQARLVLGGRGTENYADAALGIEGLGFVDSDHDVLQAGQIFINPQKIGSGIQLKSVVAIFAGKALVSTQMGIEGIPGKDGEHFVVAESPEEMAARIIALMEHPEEAQRIADQARATVAQAFSAEHFKESTQAELDAVVRRVQEHTSQDKG